MHVDSNKYEAYQNIDFSEYESFAEGFEAELEKVARKHNWNITFKTTILTIYGDSPWYRRALKLPINLFTPLYQKICTLSNKEESIINWRGIQIQTPKENSSTMELDRFGCVFCDSPIKWGRFLRLKIEVNGWRGYCSEVSIHFSCMNEMSKLNEYIWGEYGEEIVTNTYSNL